MSHVRSASLPGRLSMRSLPEQVAQPAVPLEVLPTPMNSANVSSSQQIQNDAMDLMMHGVAQPTAVMRRGLHWARKNSTLMLLLALPTTIFTILAWANARLPSDGSMWHLRNEYRESCFNDQARNLTLSEKCREAMATPTKDFPLWLQRRGFAFHALSGKTDQKILNMPEEPSYPLTIALVLYSTFATGLLGLLYIRSQMTELWPQTVSPVRQVGEDHTKQNKWVDSVDASYDETESQNRSGPSDQLNSDAVNHLVCATRALVRLHARRKEVQAELAHEQSLNRHFRKITSCLLRTSPRSKWYVVGRRLQLRREALQLRNTAFHKALAGLTEQMQFFRCSLINECGFKACDFTVFETVLKTVQTIKNSRYRQRLIRDSRLRHRQNDVNAASLTDDDLTASLKYLFDISTGEFSSGYRPDPKQYVPNHDQLSGDFYNDTTGGQSTFHGFDETTERTKHSNIYPGQILGTSPDNGLLVSRSWAHLSRMRELLRVNYDEDQSEGSNGA